MNIKISEFPILDEPLSLSGVMPIVQNGRNYSVPISSFVINSTVSKSTILTQLSGGTDGKIGNQYIPDSLSSYCKASDNSIYHLNAPLTTVTGLSSGILNLDMSKSSNFIVSLSSDLKLNIINPLAGVMVLYVVQATSGGHSLSLGASFRTINGDQPTFSSNVGEVDIVTLISNGSLTYVNTISNWKKPYEVETLNYLSDSSASISIKENLNNWIIGLKSLSAFDTSRMWILRSAYQGFGSVVYGLGGGNNINAAMDSGSGSITKGVDEYYFSGVGASIKITGTNILPTTPTGSYMVVWKNPQFFTHYGAGIGGERGTLGLQLYSGFSASDGSSGNAVSYGGTDIYGGSGGLPGPNRISALMSVTGEKSGKVSVYGSPLVSGVAGNKNYSAFSRSLNTTIAGNPLYSTPGDTTYSLVCMWTDDQSSKSSEIYTLYKSTIGSGLSLP